MILQNKRMMKLFLSLRHAFHAREGFPLSFLLPRKISQGLLNAWIERTKLLHFFQFILESIQLFLIAGLFFLHVIHYPLFAPPIDKRIRTLVGITGFLVDRLMVLQGTAQTGCRSWIDMDGAGGIRVGTERPRV